MKREISCGGLSSRSLDEAGESEYGVNFEFFWFEGQIYFLRFAEGFCVLLKITSENPDQDWQWLQNVLGPDTYLITYTGLDLDEESSILAVCYTLTECYDWMRNLARKNGVSEKLLKMDSVMYEEVMINRYNIGYSELSEVRSDPYGHLRRCDEDSMWTLVNNDFSRITAKRWSQIEKRIKFPKVKYTSEEEDELVEIHTQIEKKSWRYAQ